MYNDRLNQEKDRINKLKRIASYFRGKSHFEEDGTQNCLVFQPIYRYFKRIIGTASGNYIYFWKSMGLSDESFISNTASNYKITLELSYYDTKIRIKFKGSCLKQAKFTYSPKNIHYL